MNSGGLFAVSGRTEGRGAEYEEGKGDAWGDLAARSHPLYEYPAPTRNARLFLDFYEVFGANEEISLVGFS